MTTSQQQVNNIESYLIESNVSVSDDVVKLYSESDEYSIESELNIISDKLTFEIFVGEELHILNDLEINCLYDFLNSQSQCESNAFTYADKQHAETLIHS